MLELKSLSLVRVVMFLELQIFIITAKVLRAFYFLILTSASVPPSLLMILPSYLKDSTSSSGSPLRVTGCSVVVFSLNILVLRL